MTTAETARRMHHRSILSDKCWRNLFSRHFSSGHPDGLLDILVDLITATSTLGHQWVVTGARWPTLQRLVFGPGCDRDGWEGREDVLKSRQSVEFCMHRPCIHWHTSPYDVFPSLLCAKIAQNPLDNSRQSFEFCLLCLGICRLLRHMTSSPRPAMCENWSKTHRISPGSSSKSARTVQLLVLSAPRDVSPACYVRELLRTHRVARRLSRVRSWADPSLGGKGGVGLKVEQMC
jgi:hypothetical protein